MTLLGVVLVSIISAQITYYLIHQRHWPTIRASAFPALVFAILLTLLDVNWGGALRAAFFGATFVGMTDKSRLGWRRVLIASVIFGFVFTFLIPLAKGIGGGLGAAAFAACSVVLALTNVAKKLVKA